MNVQRRKLVHDAIVRLADGDRAAIQVLVDELWPAISTFAQVALRHEQDAEDVAQEVFLRICSRISEFDRARDGVAWAFGIASYQISTQRRRRSRRREAAGDDALEREVQPGASHEEALVQRDLLEALRQVLGSLSDEDRASLGLSDPRGPGEVSGATLRKRRQRALDRLRGLWRRRYGEP